MDTPNMHKLKDVMPVNLMHNNKVTTEDIQFPKKWYGIDLESLKGKLAINKPLTAINSIIEISNQILRENEEVSLFKQVLKYEKFLLLHFMQP